MAGFKLRCFLCILQGITVSNVYATRSESLGNTSRASNSVRVALVTYNHGDADNPSLQARQRNGIQDALEKIASPDVEIIALASQELRGSWLPQIRGYSVKGQSYIQGVTKANMLILRTQISVYVKDDIWGTYGSDIEKTFARVLPYQGKLTKGYAALTLHKEGYLPALRFVSVHLHTELGSMLKGARELGSLLAEHSQGKVTFIGGDWNNKVNQISLRQWLQSSRNIMPGNFGQLKELLHIDSYEEALNVKPLTTALDSGRADFYAIPPEAHGSYVSPTYKWPLETRPDRWEDVELSCSQKEGQAKCKFGFLDHFYVMGSDMSTVVNLSGVVAKAVPSIVGSDHLLQYTTITVLLQTPDERFKQTLGFQNVSRREQWWEAVSRSRMNSYHRPGGPPPPEDAAVPKPHFSKLAEVPEKPTPKQDEVELPRIFSVPKKDMSKFGQVPGKRRPKNDEIEAPNVDFPKLAEVPEKRRPEQIEAEVPKPNFNKPAKLPEKQNMQAPLPTPTPNLEKENVVNIAMKPVVSIRKTTGQRPKDFVAAENFDNLIDFWKSKKN